MKPNNQVANDGPNIKEPNNQTENQRAEFSELLIMD